jgi:hypothetical protein
MITNYQSPALLSDSANKHANSFIFSVRKLLNLPFIVLLITQFFSPALRAQQQAALLFENATQQGVQEALYKDNITKSANDFIYTAGASINASGNYDIIVTKHNNANVELWTQVWSNTAYDGLDMAADLTIDSNGDIIVVGTTQLSLTNYDAVVVKYSSAGALLWSQTFNGTTSGPDGFVTVLAIGTTIYCGGSILNNVLQQHDALAVKYNGAGQVEWSHTYNSSNNLRDGHNRIAISGSNVIFYGGVQTLANPITWTMVRLELNATSGAQVSANLANNASATFTQITDIDIDAQDNIYIAGHVNSAQGKDLKVVKLVSMAVSWTFTYNGPANLDDEANCIDVSGSFVYVAGYTTTAGTGKDLYTAKIPLAGPPVSWTKIIDQDGGDDTFTALNIDAGGQLYLAGSVYRVSNLDLCVYKLNFSSGAITAHNTYNNDYNGNDYATGVAIDEQGNVFVAGQSQVTTDSYKYNLTKWAQKTVYMPVVPHSSAGGYLANVSQLRNDDGSANESVLFYNQQNRVATYLNDSTMMYQLIQAADSTNVDTTYRVDMRFTKGNTNQKLYAWDARKEYTNFYLSHMTRKGERTPSYNGIWKQSVYTNTDVVYTNGPSGCKQYIIARSGAPTGDFEMTFGGQTSLSIAANGNLIIATTIGQIEYAKPKAYSMNLTSGALTLHSWQPSYAISSNKVSFNGIGSWGGTLVLEVGEQTLIMGGETLLDPGNLSWSTYFCGQGNKNSESYDIVYDPIGSLYGIGQSSQLSFPILNGENITSTEFYGSSDGALVSFTSEKIHQWSTVYGGNNEDFFYAIDVHPLGNELILGGASRSNDIVLNNQPGSGFETSFHLSTNGQSDQYDGLLLKVTPDGFLLWSTFIGSSNHFESIVDIVAHNNGFFVVGNATESTISIDSNEPIELPIWDNGGNATYDSTVSGSDIFVMHFDDLNNIDWSTLYGNGTDDQAYESILVPTLIGIPSLIIALKANISSSASSANYPNSFLQTSNESTGGIVRFSISGEVIWSTAIRNTHNTQSLAYFEDGSNSKIIAGSLALYNINGTTSCDPDQIANNEVCLCNTYASGVYDSICQDDLYLTEFNLNQELVWSSFLGGDSDESGSTITGILDEGYDQITIRKFFDLDFDSRGYLYLTGLSTISVFNTAFPILTNSSFYNGDYYNSNAEGHGDNYLVAFDASKNCIWSTIITAGTTLGDDLTSSIWGSEWPNQVLAYGETELTISGSCFNKSWPYVCPVENAWCQNGEALFDLNKHFKRWVYSSFDISDNTISTQVEIKSKQEQFLIYPNPAQFTFTVVSQANAPIKKISIYNLASQIVYESKLENKLKTDISPNELAPGVYFIEIFTEKYSETSKIIIQ